MEPHNGPDCPPPPYSETDIYTFSPGSHNNHPSGADDNASIAPSSSTSNIIFTPPDSPREAQYSFAGPNSDQDTTSSAQAYFDSRPPNRPPGPEITIPLEITPDAAPSNFPYPKVACDRDITEQDWETFVNHLIPGYAARVNSRIIDRKIRDAEGSGPSAGDNIAEAQLPPPEASKDTPVSLQNIEAAISEWNHGFFNPRGVTIRHTTLAEPAVEETQPPGNEPSRTASADAGQSQRQPQPSSWWRNTFGAWGGDEGGLRIGPLHVEGDRVALGSTFEADRNGIRWRGGPGAPRFEASPGGVRWGEHPHPFNHWGSRGPFGGPFGSPFGGHGRGRGGHEHGLGRGHRDRSCSSISSSSSLSSSGSDSSIGSLPDWDDLRDVQLPVTKRSVQAWLSHPDQPVTKDMLKKAKAEIKTAKNAVPPPPDPSWDQARESLRREVKDLLQQFKMLKRQQRTAKRAARREARQKKRAARQERRERRRADRQERRGHEHESRWTDRAARRAERGAERQARRHRHHHPVPHPGPATPPVPSVPPFPHASHAFHPPAPPPSHTGPEGFFSGGGGGGGRGGGPFGRGSFAPLHPPPPGFPFCRGFGRGRDRDRGWGWQPSNDATGQASRFAAEMSSMAEKEREKALAQAAQAREEALAQAERARESAAKIAEESCRAAVEAMQRGRAGAEKAQRVAAETAARAAEESRRVAMEAVRRSRAETGAAHRTAADAASRAAVDAKLAEARALESQIEAKAGQIQVLEENLGRDQDLQGDGGEKSAAGSEKLRAIEQLEEEMDRLGQKVEALRIEADEELARRLAQREASWGEWE